MRFKAFAVAATALLMTADLTAQMALTIPAGTQITVRLLDAIDGKTAQAGMRFRASIDDPVAVGSQMAIPHDSNCTVEVVSVDNSKGMELRLRDFTLNGKVYSTSTEFTDVAAKGTSKRRRIFRRGVGLGGLGAGIGALAGGGEGAAIGAAVGAGVGALSGTRAKGKQTELPTESRLIFTLTAPVPLN